MRSSVLFSSPSTLLESLLLGSPVPSSFLVAGRPSDSAAPPASSPPSPKSTPEQDLGSDIGIQSPATISAVSNTPVTYSDLLASSHRAIAPLASEPGAGPQATAQRSSNGRSASGHGTPGGSKARATPRMDHTNGRCAPLMEVLSKANFTSNVEIRPLNLFTQGRGLGLGLTLPPPVRNTRTDSGDEHAIIPITEVAPGSLASAVPNHRKPSVTGLSSAHIKNTPTNTEVASGLRPSESRDLVVSPALNLSLAHKASAVHSNGEVASAMSPETRDIASPGHAAASFNTPCHQPIFACSNLFMSPVLETPQAATGSSPASSVHSSQDPAPSTTSGPSYAREPQPALAIDIGRGCGARLLPGMSPLTRSPARLSGSIYKSTPAPVPNVADLQDALSHPGMSPLTRCPARLSFYQEQDSPVNASEPVAPAPADELLLSGMSPLTRCPARLSYPEDANPITASKPAAPVPTTPEFLLSIMSPLTRCPARLDAVPNEVASLDLVAVIKPSAPTEKELLCATMSPLTRCAARLSPMEETGADLAVVLPGMSPLVRCPAQLSFDAEVTSPTVGDNKPTPAATKMQQYAALGRGLPSVLRTAIQCAHTSSPSASPQTETHSPVLTRVQSTAHNLFIPRIFSERTLFTIPEVRSPEAPAANHRHHSNSLPTTSPRLQQQSPKGTPAQPSVFLSPIVLLAAESVLEDDRKIRKKEGLKGASLPAQKLAMLVDEEYRRMGITENTKKKYNFLF